MNGSPERQWTAEDTTIRVLHWLGFFLAALIGGLVVYAVQLPAPNSLSDWLTPFVAFGTLAQAVFAYFALQGLSHARRSADAATQSISEMRTTSERQLRAYVSVTSFEFEALRVGARFKVTVNYANSGQTPAHDLSIVSRLVFHGIDENVEFEEATQAESQNASRANLGVGASITHVASMTNSLTMDELLSLQLGRGKIIICGEITYRDAFDCQRVTRFHAALSTANPAGLFEFRRSSRGNYMT